MTAIPYLTKVVMRRLSSCRGKAARRILRAGKASPSKGEAVSRRLTDEGVFRGCFSVRPLIRPFGPPSPLWGKASRGGLWPPTCGMVPATRAGLGPAPTGLPTPSGLRPSPLDKGRRPKGEGVSGAHLSKPSPLGEGGWPKARRMRSFRSAPPAPNCEPFVIPAGNVPVRRTAVLL